jgi:nucleotide-binding universal stress UspA family protein
MKILVATDGSSSALKAVKKAAQLALSLRDPGHISLLSVHDDIGLRHVKRFVDKGTVEDYLRERSENELKPARKVLDKAGVSFDMIIRTGSVPEQIVTTARKGKFDLIVVGSSGPSALGEFFLGSVTHRVASSAEQDVMIVR